MNGVTVAFVEVSDVDLVLVGLGVEHDQPPHELRVARGQGDGDLSAGRVTGNERPADAQLAHRVGQPVGLLCHRVAVRGLLRAAVAEQVEEHHLIPPREQRPDVGPPVDGGRPAVDQDDRRRSGRARALHVDVAAGQVHDLPGVARARRLGVVVDDDLVDDEADQQDRYDDAERDEQPSAQ